MLWVMAVSQKRCALKIFSDSAGGMSWLTAGVMRLVSGAPRLNSGGVCVFICSCGLTVTLSTWHLKQNKYTLLLWNAVTTSLCHWFGENGQGQPDYVIQAPCENNLPELETGRCAGHIEPDHQILSSLWKYWERRWLHINRYAIRRQNRGCILLRLVCHILHRTVHWLRSN